MPTPALDAVGLGLGLAELEDEDAVGLGVDVGLADDRGALEAAALAPEVGEEVAPLDAAAVGVLDELPLDDEVLDAGEALDPCEPLTLLALLSACGTVPVTEIADPDPGNEAAPVPAPPLHAERTSATLTRMANAPPRIMA